MKIIPSQFLFFFSLFISGCSSETKFIPHELPIAQFNKPYFVRIELPPGEAVYCHSLYARIEPVNSGISSTIEYFHSNENKRSFFCRTIDIQGTPKTNKKIIITVTGGGPAHSSIVNQKYIIEVK
ncbi:hypothetical protein QZP89_13855 [Citrobacter werkmanii]|uniref:hypothetical protein n=1 Tax=Citrobacter TaxID=544 RepID=UPI00050822A0|nr:MULTISPECIES: hypothetical protein [Citrobacter]EGT0638811.1 hypothetical protein [Citrobacter werkmanii]EGT0674043.1 hypothetical protein [Citrobacter werkmanii]MDN8552893.1 hypothetical protein [Citrobacter werkmanii]MDT0638498.1 hypothetical protein [Citrobacter werkmanii]TKU68146.1 hypothetical protein FDX14_24285 [Citrobacter sp. wls710]